jgi:hypothetical protein
MYSEQHLPKLCNAVAFGAHFHPDRLLGKIKHANCSNNNARPWMTKSHHDILHDHSVCTMIFRDPVERTISGYYEWIYQRTKLTAIQYLRQYGPERFIQIEQQSNWVVNDDTGTNLLETIFTSCLLGVTEHMTDYVTALSRVLLVAPPKQKAVRARSRERYGMHLYDLANFYEQLTPFLQRDIALWQLAQRVAAAQYQVAKQAVPLLRDLPVQDRSNRMGDCPNCKQCTPPGYERFRWTSYLNERGVCVGPNIRLGDDALCCTHQAGN